jgi:ABC-2 type transport system permease protein
VPEDSGQLANDLFERIVRFDNRIADATYEERGDGSFRVRVELELRKLRTDTEGEEADVPVDDWIDIALSVAAGGQSENHELTLAAHRIQGSRATIETTIDQRPTRVTIDPYYKLIDRDRSDNVRDLAPAGAATRR